MTAENLARAKNSRADTHMGGAESDSRFKIRTHPHGQMGQPVARCNLGKKCKMRGRLFTLGRDAHQPCRYKAVFVPARRDKGIRFGRMNAGLLRLFPRINLDIYQRYWDAYQPGGKARPIEGFDHIKQGKGIGNFVGLERSDQMQLNIRVALAKAGPFGGCLLDPVFTKYAMAGLKRRRDRVNTVTLADGNQTHRLGITAGVFCRRHDTRADRAQISRDISLTRGRGNTGRGTSHRENAPYRWNRDFCNWGHWKLDSEQ